MEIHERIFILRKSLKLTRKDFSEKIGISINTLRAFEGKGVTPKSNVLIKIISVWHCFSLWLLTEESSPLNGQLDPSLLEERDNLISYHVIDVIGSDLNDLIINSKHIEKVIFLQTDSVPYSNEANRLFNSLNNKECSEYQGTGMLLILKGEPVRGIKKAVLVENGFFDIYDIANQKNTDLFSDYQSWFMGKLIRNFEIVKINHKTIFALKNGCYEIMIKDLYSPDEMLNTALSIWNDFFIFKKQL